MNFFEQQEESKQKSFQLVLLFILAVIGVVLALYVAALVILYYSETDKTGAAFNWVNPEILFCVVVVALTLILGGSLVKIVALRRGGRYIAESLDGRLVNPSTTDLKEKRLINVVEEMAIASGISVPLAYVLDNEGGINAFAAGYHPNDAVVAVTAGCLQQLTREELQGVVGHEFSHILNGDMRINIRLLALISGIMVIATIGYYILRSGSTSRSRKGGGPIVLMGLAMVIIGYIGVFFSHLIQSAVSKQREYLADASSVQFTRNPTGLANALKKIGGFSMGSKIKAPLASETSHMFFGSAISSFFATHPPLAERIRRIDPSFAGDFSSLAKFEGTADQEGGVMGLADAGRGISMDAESAKAQIGTVSPEHVEYSSKLLDLIPPAVRFELADPLGASAVVFTLLLDENPERKNIQLANLKKEAPADIIGHMLKLDRDIAGMDRRLRLPVVDISMQSLRRMSDVQFEKFSRNVRILVESDARLSLFEFCLQQIINHRLAETYRWTPKKELYKSIEPLAGDAVKLIAKLAEAGSADKTEARKAYEAAVQKIPAPQAAREMPAASEITFSDLGRAISKISSAKPAIKEIVFEACAICVLSDRTITQEESELLRAVAYCLDLPMPPFLAQ